MKVWSFKDVVDVGSEARELTSVFYTILHFNKYMTKGYRMITKTKWQKKSNKSEKNNGVLVDTLLIQIPRYVFVKR